MKTLLFIALGLLPAVFIRFVMMRRRLEVGPAIGVCLGILLLAAISATSLVERRFTNDVEDQTLGPIPILADFVWRMITIPLPVTVMSFLILRIRSHEQ
jgi:hypothetical protein